MSSPKLLKRPIAGSVSANGRLQTPAPIQDWLKAKNPERAKPLMTTCTRHIEGNFESYEEGQEAPPRRGRCPAEAHQAQEIHARVAARAQACHCCADGSANSFLSSGRRCSLCV
jgi:hypothetical protein